MSAGDIARKHRLSGSDQAVIERIVTSFRRSWHLAQTFEPKRFGGRMLFFRASLSHGAKPAIHDWASFVSDGMAIHEVPSDHYTMFDQKHCAATGSVLSQHLLQVGSHTPSLYRRDPARAGT